MGQARNETGSRRADGKQMLANRQPRQGAEPGHKATGGCHYGGKEYRKHQQQRCRYTVQQHLRCVCADRYQRILGNKTVHHDAAGKD